MKIFLMAKIVFYFNKLLSKKMTTLTHQPNINIKLLQWLF